MYFLERRERYSMPNILGGHSMPVDTYRWRQVAVCSERSPLERMLESLPQKEYRIISNSPQEEELL